MIANRYITKIVALLMAVAVVLCLCATVFGDQIVSSMGGLGVSMEYESKLFDTGEVLEVNILMDNADWQDLLDNAINEEFVQCDVEIAGETFYRVGIRPKGNTSLSSIVNDPTTDRYSLKLEFDQYVEGQTCYGLDKLVLNNSYADATYMKETLIYDMFQELGADASLYNYAKVSVNGEYWGLYIALEAVEESFMLRNYGTANGKLYKPDSMNMGGGDRGNMPDMENRNFSNMERPSRNPNQSSNSESPAFPEGEVPIELDQPDNFKRPDMDDFNFEDFKADMGGGKGGFGGGMFGNGGSNLNYSDDDLDSYSTIWDGEVTASNDIDHKRVVTALKNISNGTNLEQYMDIDNLLKYMAVHIFSENDDSLSGSMAHNYYLYENNGQLNILPWDYNLAFGGMGMGRSSGATDTVNAAIDDAWNGTDFFDTLLANEEYHAAYYDTMKQVVDYIQNGSFEEFYNRTRNLVDTLVETDPNAFYSYEEYLTAVETLYEVVTLRGQSIHGQLEGSIPSTETEQRNSDALIDASHIDLSAMGTMSMGGGGFSFGGRDENREEQNGDASPSEPPSDNSGKPSNDFSGFGNPEEQPIENFDPSQFEGQMPGNFDFSQFGGQMPNDPSLSQDRELSSDKADFSQFSGQIPGGYGTQGQNIVSTILIYGLSTVIMVTALLFALFFRRRPK